MNVMLTSVGRRAYMVKYFKEVLKDSGRVYVCNSDNRSIAFKYADECVISPLIYDKAYIPFLLEYCTKNKMDIVIPLFDIDILMISKNKKEFEKIGVRAIVSDKELVSICNDKWLTYNFLRDHAFNTPLSFIDIREALKSIEDKKLNYPIVVKPRYGCGSIGVTTAYDKEDLVYLTKKVNEDIKNSYLSYESADAANKVIYQEYLKGQEYGADIINNLDGDVQNIIIRKKLAMRSGETDIAQLVEDSAVRDTLLRLGRITKHVANMDCDIFLTDGRIYILEMNARFGGGYPFSHMGGCNLPKAIIDWTLGKEIDKNILTARTGITGYKEIYITEGLA